MSRACYCGVPLLLDASGSWCPSCGCAPVLPDTQPPPGLSRMAPGDVLPGLLRRLPNGRHALVLDPETVVPIGTYPEED